MNFDSFAGNEYLKKNLLLAAKTSKLMNSYIFAGESGIGKKTLTACFAAAVLCENIQEYGPCGECSACKQFFAHTHPDVFYLKRTDDKKTIGINEVREQIIKNVYTKPFSAVKKIFIIEDGDSLTQEAQNGLLKVLEEPPDYVMFITVAESLNTLLDTVRSRSMVLRLHPVSRVEVRDVLQKRCDDKDMCDFCADFSQGVIGKGIKILENEAYRELFYKTSELLANVLMGHSAVDLRTFLTDNKENIDDIIDFMLVFGRDALLCCEKMSDYVICKRNIPKLPDEMYNKRKFVDFMDSLTMYKKKLAANANFSIATLEFITEIS